MQMSHAELIINLSDFHLSGEGNPRSRKRVLPKFWKCLDYETPEIPTMDGGDKEAQSSAANMDSLQQQQQQQDDENGVRVFNTRGRPDLTFQQSYVVGQRTNSMPFSEQDGPSSKKRRSLIPSLGSIDDRLLKLQGTSSDGVKSPPLLPSRRSRSQKRAQSTDDRQGSAEEDPKKELQQIQSPDRATATRGPDGSQGVTGRLEPLKSKLADLHAKHPHLANSVPSRPLLPIVAFPNQGNGKMSEFDLDAPIWARQPYKIIYFIYFGLSIGLVFLPWFAFISLFPSRRARPTWTWKKSTLVKLYRHGTRLTFRTHTSLSRDLSEEVPHSKTLRCKFVWVKALEDANVRGDVRKAMHVQGLKPSRTCGFWYGERDGGGGVGQRATKGEKVVYHLHGGAYWIGTAHEKDVTSAVNVQLLKALDGLYTERVRAADRGNLVKPEHGKEPPPSPHPPQGGPAPSVSTGGHCKRSFSLDYRLCVPGRPEIGSYPAALLDALAGYRYLVGECGFEPENIVVAGDSAGGNLALALCRYLRDEGLDGMPGAMLLLSPWSDTSRSHSGPTNAPNKLSTSYTHSRCDIISPSISFRNTAVGALLGKLPARETYRNPYLSSISLQLSPDKGGSGPDWGFQGFPKKIYISTGTAEISHDQHLTLAYRLAGGTRRRVPLSVGCHASRDEDPYELAARLCYPRPEDHEVTLWPSAQNTPLGTPLGPPMGGGRELTRKEQEEAENQPAVYRSMKPTPFQRGPSNLNPAAQGKIARVEELQDQDAKEWETGRLEEENLSPQGAYKNTAEALAPNEAAGEGSPVDEGELREADQQKGSQVTHGNAFSPHVRGAGAKEEEEEGGEKKTEASSSVSSSSSSKEKDEQRLAGKERPTHRLTHYPSTSAFISMKDEKCKDGMDRRYRFISYRGRDKPDEEDEEKAIGMGESCVENGHHVSSNNNGNPDSYFDLGGEDRVVVLDECLDGIHDFTLFDWFEPERTDTWQKIARWLDQDHSSFTG